MGQYKIIRTDTADAGLRKIILSIAENFGTETAVKKRQNLSPISGNQFWRFY